MSDRGELSFDACMMTYPVSTECRSAVAEAALCLVELEMSISENENYSKEVSNLKQAIVGIGNRVESSMPEAWKIYDDEIAKRDKAVALAKELVDRLSIEHNAVIERWKEAEAKVAMLERYEQERLREHNPQSPEVRAKVYAMTDGKCAYCGCEISPGRDDGKPEFVIEHVVPKSAGGPDHLTNYVPSCSCCNANKSTGHVIEFIRRRAGG